MQPSCTEPNPKAQAFPVSFSHYLLFSSLSFFPFFLPLLSLFLFLSLSLSFSFFSFSFFFSSFLPSSLFLFSPWGWVRRCLAASLSLLSVSCFCFLCFQFPLSLLSAFAFSLPFVFCFSLRFLYIFSSFHFFLHFLFPWLGAYIGSHGV